MERTIGNLGEEVKQPSQPFANISQRGVLRCQINALLAMVPSMSPTSLFPSGSIPLEFGYVLLGAKDKNPQSLPPSLSQLIQQNLSTTGTISTAPQTIRLI